MKAKLWVAKLVEILETGDGEDFVKEALVFHTECLELVRDRLLIVQRSHTVNDESTERMAAAYREAAVKWEAVRHGVSVKTGSEGHFPLMKGGILLNLINNLSTVIAEGPIDLKIHRPVFDHLQTLIKKLGYADIKWIEAMMQSMEMRLNRASNKLVSDGIDHFAELQLLSMRAGLGGIDCLTDAEKKRHRELRDLLKEELPQIRSHLQTQR